MKPRKQGDIAVKLDPKKYYTLVLFDTLEYGTYRNIAFKYYLPGNTRSITVKEENIESDFGGHCEEGIEDRDLEDIYIRVNNKSLGNLVKMYYKFDAGKTYERFNYLFQWNPIYKNTRREIRQYDVKPKEQKKFFIKYYLEKKGIISEHLFESEFKDGSNTIDLIIE